MVFSPYFLVTLIAVCAISCTPFEQDKGKIVINNQSPDLISAVSIEYNSSQKVDLIGDIPANASYRYTLEYSDTEDSVDINYTDKASITHSENVVPYGGKYDEQTYTINIK